MKITRHLLIIVIVVSLIVVSTASVWAENDEPQYLFLPFIRSGTPAQLPANPANLSVLLVDNRIANLEWQDRSNNEDHFWIEGSVNDQPFIELGSVAANTTSYQVDLPIAGTWVFRVKAGNETGFSDYAVSLSINRPIIPTQVRITNASQDLLMTLEIDDQAVEFPDEKTEIATGGNFVINLSPGTHEYVAYLGEIRYGNRMVYYQVLGEFELIYEQITDVAIKPITIQLLTDYEDVAGWSRLDQTPIDLPLSICFYANGIYLATYAEQPDPEQGVLVEIGAIPLHLTFNLDGTYHQHPGDYTPSNNKFTLGIYPGDMAEYLFDNTVICPSTP